MIETLGGYDTVRIGGIDVARLGLGEATGVVGDLAAQPDASLVFTANVDHLRLIDENPAFANAYAAATLRTADGRPLVWMSKLLGRPLPGTVSGSALEPALSESLGGSEDTALLYIGGSEEANALAVRNRSAQHPKANVQGISPSMGYSANPDECAELAGWVNETAKNCAKVAVFWCTGAPQSEIVSHQLVTAGIQGERIERGVIIPAGAAIDYAAGTKAPASQAMQDRGFAWAQRILSEGRRAELIGRYSQDARFLGGLTLRTLRERRNQPEVVSREDEALIA